MAAEMQEMCHILNSHLKSAIVFSFRCAGFLLFLFGSIRGMQADPADQHSAANGHTTAVTDLGPHPSEPGTTKTAEAFAPSNTGTVSRPDPLKPQQGLVRPNASGDYRVGAGDVLQISVWKEPEASVASVVVRPDGKVTMPLLKDVAVVGLTPSQIEGAITEGLSAFIPSADVTVIVTGMNSKKIYVIGAVKKEGPIAYTYRMTVMQAIAEAGGLTDYAKRKKIYVLRAENGTERKIPFDYDGTLKGKPVDNVPLLPSDTLVVPH